MHEKFIEVKMIALLSDAFSCTVVLVVVTLSVNRESPVKCTLSAFKKHE